MRAIDKVSREEYNAYHRVAYRRYRAGEAWDQRMALLRERKTVARRMLEALTPVASHDTVAKMLGITKQAVQQAETRILYKIYQRMRDPNFTP